MRYQKPVRIAELDILRGIAIVLVLGRHLLTIPPQLPFPIYFVLTFWRRIGWAGVDLFFVLSGFLVSGLLFQNYKRLGKVGPLTFLVRRGFKIYPALYVLLLILYMSSVYLNAWPHSG